MTKNSLAMIALVLFIAGCGQQAGNEGTTASRTRLEKAVTGIVSNLGEKEFTLVTLPGKLEEQPGRTLVDFSGAKVIDVDGKKSTLTQDSTVKVEGDLADRKIIASNITIESTSSNAGGHLASPSMTQVVTAVLLEKFLGAKVPKGFGAGWKLENTGTLKDSPGSVIYQYNRQDWKLILVKDPKTPEKYEITLHGPNGFVWSGMQDDMDKIRQR